MVETVITIVLLILAILAIWPYFVDLCSRTIIPFIRRKVGSSVSEPMASLLTWVDRPACAGRSVVMKGWRTLSGQITRLKTTYQKKSPTTMLESTESELSDPISGKRFISTVDYEIPWEEVPTRIRDQMNIEGTVKAELDVKDKLKKAVEHRAKKEEIEVA
jgi:hypothetical protein